MLGLNNLVCHCKLGGYESVFFTAQHVVFYAFICLDSFPQNMIRTPELRDTVLDAIWEYAAAIAFLLPKAYR
jgi:hypothetical protein